MTPQRRARAAPGGRGRAAVGGAGRGRVPAPPPPCPPARSALPGPLRSLREGDGRESRRRCCRLGELGVPRALGGKPSLGMGLIFAKLWSLFGSQGGRAGPKRRRGGRRVEPAGLRGPRAAVGARGRLPSPGFP